MSAERCWGEKCRKSVCTSPRHPKPRSSASSQHASKEAASASQRPAMRIPKGGLSGHAYERANICAECGGPLAASDGHYHSRSIWGEHGAEPICCKHSPQKCYIDPLAHFKGYGVTYYPAEKGELAGEVEDSEEADDNQEFMEEQDVSKTSQNQKVQEAMKGQKAAKAAKAPKEPKAKKEKAVLAPFVPTLLPANYKGNAVGTQVDTGKQWLDSIHAVADGKTACGYPTQVASKGELSLRVNKVATKSTVTCGRCIRFANKAVAEAKKPTPIKAAKAKKEAAAATS